MDESTYIPPGDTTNVDPPPHADKVDVTDQATRARVREDSAGAGPWIKGVGDDDDRKRDLQTKCYLMHLKGATYESIGRKFDLDRKTVAKYVALECERRREENRDAPLRQQWLDQAESFYNDRRNKLVALADSSIASVADIAKLSKVAIDSQRALDSLHGLDAPTSAPIPQPLAGLPASAVLELVRMMSARKTNDGH